MGGWMWVGVGEFGVGGCGWGVWVNVGVCGPGYGLRVTVQTRLFWLHFVAG